MSEHLRIPRALPPGYRIDVGPVPLDSYLHLRQASGLSPKTSEQGSRALQGSWYMVHVIHDPQLDSTLAGSGESVTTQSQIVGMTRIIGDGGWYFHIVDVCVLPEHRRKGLADIMMHRCLKHILDTVPSKPYITLLADPPGITLYQRCGFEWSAPESTGMVWNPAVLIKRQQTDSSEIRQEGNAVVLPST